MSDFIEPDNIHYTLVNQHNWQEVVGDIEDLINENYVTAALDTEFPGNPLGSDLLWHLPERNQDAYDVAIRRNVNISNMISLG